MDKNFEHKLKEAGLKLTKPRKLIMSILLKSKYPLSIRDIHDKLKNVDIDQVTIYRTLSSFKTSGIVNQIDFQKDHALYEIKDDEHDHHHLVCTMCDKIEDFDGCNYEKIASVALKNNKNFYKITGHSFEFFGICNKCIKK